MINLKDTKAATLVEYCITLTILIGLFVAAFTFFKSSAESRRDKAAQSQNQALPCDGGLSGDDCL